MTCQSKKIFLNLSYSESQGYIGLQCLLRLLLVKGNMGVVVIDGEACNGYLSSYSVQAAGQSRGYEENDPTAARSTPPRLSMCTRNPRESWLPPCFLVLTHTTFLLPFCFIVLHSVHHLPELSSYFQFSRVHLLPPSEAQISMLCF